MSSDPRIKGFALRGLFKYVKESDYPGGIPALIDKLPPDAAAYFEEQILTLEKHKRAGVGSENVSDVIHYLGQYPVELERRGNSFTHFKESTEFSHFESNHAVQSGIFDRNGGLVGETSQETNLLLPEPDVGLYETIEDTHHLLLGYEGNR